MTVNPFDIVQKMNEYHVMGASVAQINNGKLFSSHH